MTNVLMQPLNKMHMNYVLHNKFRKKKKFRMIIFHDQKALSLNFKGSCLQMFFKIDVFKNFAMLTEKHLCWSYFFNIVAGLEDNNSINKTLTQVLSCEYCKIFNTYFEEHLRTAASVLLII